MSTLKSIVASYFEGVIAGNFKTAADGQRLFYPWNVWSNGYVLPDAQTEQRIRKSLKIIYMVWLPLVIIATVIAISYGFYYTLACVPVLLLIYGVGVRSLTRGLLTTRERLRVTESWANSARAYSSGVLWFVFIVSALFVVGGAGMILLGQIAIGLLNILFFGACGAGVCYMLRMRS